MQLISWLVVNNKSSHDCLLIQEDAAWQYLQNRWYYGRLCVSGSSVLHEPMSGACVSNVLYLPVLGYCCFRNPICECTSRNSLFFCVANAHIC